MYILSITTVITGPANNGNKAQTEKELHNLRKKQENCCLSGFKVAEEEQSSRILFPQQPFA
jgi:tryptophan synthase alpha subunit